MVYPVDRLHPKWSAPDTTKHIAALSCVRLHAERETTLAYNEIAGAYYVCVSPNHTKDSTDCAAMRVASAPARLGLVQVKKAARRPPA